VNFVAEYGSVGPKTFRRVWALSEAEYSSVRLPILGAQKVRSEQLAAVAVDTKERNPRARASLPAASGNTMPSRGLVFS
jgi:hypothetical protein